MTYTPFSRRDARRPVLGFTLAGLLALLLALPMSARAADSLSCRASAEHYVGAGDPPSYESEPVRANAPYTPCATQSAETLKPTTTGPVGADALEAYTVAATGRGDALAGASRPAGTLGGLQVGAADVQASANVTCTDGRPVFTGRSRVSGLTINGQRITLPDDDQPLDLLGGVVELNETVRTSTGLVQNAVHVHVDGVGDLVLGQAKVGGSADACANQEPNGPGPQVCPNGSEFDPGSGVCVIRLPGSDRVIVIGPPYTGPSGGTVVPLPTARDEYHSPCLYGRGLPYAVVGSNGNDNVTGTNGSDRILLLRGNDRADGGRGDDCLDGGPGRDVLAGGLGNDREYGASGNDRTLGGFGNDTAHGGSGNDFMRGDAGNDHMWGDSGRDFLLGGGDKDLLHGGSGNDRVYGEQQTDIEYGDSGNDTVRAGYGRDKMYGGSGNDFLGAFLYGPTVRMIDGGSGRDTAWLNYKELRVTRHIQRVRIFGARR